DSSSRVELASLARLATPRSGRTGGIRSRPPITPIALSEASGGRRGIKPIALSEEARLREAEPRRRVEGQGAFPAGPSTRRRESKGERRGGRDRPSLRRRGRLDRDDRHAVLGEELLRAGEEGLGRQRGDLLLEPLAAGDERRRERPVEGRLQEGACFVARA